MERHVYKPPKGSPRLNLFLAIFGGIFMTFAVFYMIPLMKKLQAVVRPSDDGVAEEQVYEEPPEEMIIEEDQPPPEEEPEDPPEMEEDSSDLDLALLELPNLSSGIGGGPLLQIAPKFDVRDNPDEFFDSGDLDQPPRATSKFSPQYPKNLLSKKITGRVIVRAMVDERGMVGDISIKESSGYAEMDRAAMNAMKRWRFKPAIKGNSKVRAPVVQPFNFKVR